MENFSFFSQMNPSKTDHSKDELELLNKFLMIQTYINLTIYTSILIVILIKIKFKLFLGFSMVLFLFEAYFILKAITNTLFFTLQEEATSTTVYSYIRCTASLINRLKWFVLYFFVLQIKTIVIKIDSDNPDDNRARQRRWEIIKKIIYAVYVPMALSIVTISILEEYPFS